MKTLFEGNFFSFDFKRFLLNSFLKCKKDVLIFSNLDFGILELMNHLAEQPCAVELPRDLDDLFLEALTLSLNLFGFCSVVGKTDWKGGPVTYRPCPQASDWGDKMMGESKV